MEEDAGTGNVGRAWVIDADVMTCVAHSRQARFEMNEAGCAHHFATMADSFLGRITSIACVSSSCGYASMTLAARYYCAKRASILLAPPPGK